MEHIAPGLLIRPNEAQRRALIIDLAVRISGKAAGQVEVYQTRDRAELAKVAQASWMIRIG